MTLGSLKIHRFNRPWTCNTRRNISSGWRTVADHSFNALLENGRSPIQKARETRQTIHHLDEKKNAFPSPSLRPPLL